MVVLLSLLPRRTVTARAPAGSYAATSTTVGTSATRLLPVMMVLVVVMTVVVMMVVLVLLRLLPVVPPFPAVVLMRYHAIHDQTTDVVGQIIRLSNKPCVHT